MSKLSRETMDSCVSIVRETFNGPAKVRIDHDDCPAGKDTKRRLNITLTEDARLVLAHCFNCGGSGVRSAPWAPPREVLVDHEGVRKAQERFVAWNYRYQSVLESLTAFDPITSGWPSEYFAPYERVLLSRNFKNFGIMQFTDVVMIPRGDPESPSGYEVRQLSAKPKWLRVVKPEFQKDSTMLIYNPAVSRVGVLVEDPISAMKMAMAAVAGVALCGSNVPEVADVIKLKTLFDYIVVWLDNDNDTVKKHALSTAEKLSLYGIPTALCAVPGDPKEKHISDVSMIVGGHVERIKMRYTTDE